MRILYTFFIYLYHVAIAIAGIFNAKAKLFTNGRKIVWQQLANNITNDENDTYWFHCASLGEFEQARPLIEGIKERNNNNKIVVSFFSPSGYEVRKKYNLANVVCYLPMDTKANALQFITAVKPKKVYFIKYEFWFNYIDVLHAHNITVEYVCTLMRSEQYFFKWYGKWFANELKKINYFFTQDLKTAQLLASIGIANVSYAGDTRYDRVVTIAQQAKPIAIIKAFAQQKKLIIIGSSWPADETMWHSLYSSNAQLSNNYKLVFAPHNVTADNITNLTLLFNKYSPCMYSNVEQNIESNIMIVDNVGMLASLYSMGTIAYIGGGFGKAVHNTLEAAVYGIPVVFGPQHTKFIEIQQLLSNNAAITVNSQLALNTAIARLISDANYYTTIAVNAKQIVCKSVGATALILNRN
jgi:3-deoxy-D-manno-octulosonic-acid transferase